ncbi:MAG: T9SS type A sorting domain-containing protein [Bacteroidia bacterium]
MFSSKVIFQSVLFRMIVLILPLSSFAQEILVPLGSNADIHSYLMEHPGATKRVATIQDTLILPFIDDFSRKGIYPFDSLWEDQDVFINNTFADSPPTIGVATFDGLNSLGQPHDSTSSAEGIADYLTSRPIDLHITGPDTSSVWLSFFYQPQGLGDIPETDDSLVVQFKTKQNDWINMWSVPGRSDTAFQRANIQVRDTTFLYKGFQFRFYNIATVNGNRDHWNIDYVILNKQTAPNDSIRDNALITSHSTLLSEFTSMPYTHYKALSSPLAAMQTVVNDTTHNLNRGQYSFTPGIKIYNETGTEIYSFDIGSTSSVSSNSYTGYGVPLNSFSYPSVAADSAKFFVVSSFERDIIGTVNPYNDSSFFTQKFFNYYSYDDGSAEIGYGVSGNTDLKIAYKFDVKKPDTLRGIQIYFNPVGLNVHNKLFQLAYWNSVDVAGNTDHLVYKMINQKPANIDVINGFATYLFDTLLVVPQGSAWVGLIQNEPQTLYGIGLDRNTDSHQKMNYHLDGFWYTSQVHGSWMIRPLFGDTLNRGMLIGIDDPTSPTMDIRMYPNPVQHEFTLNFIMKAGEKYTCSIFDLSGQLIKSEEAVSGNKISCQDLSPGFYFLRINSADKTEAGTIKFIVN